MFRPVWGVQRTALIVGAVVLIALWLYVSRRGGDVSAAKRVSLLAMRLIALGGIVFMLAGPSSYTGEESKQAPLAIQVLADVSPSMAERDVVDDKGELVSRLDAVAQRWLDEKYIRQMRQLATVRTFGFSDRLNSIQLTGLTKWNTAGNGTELFESINDSLDTMKLGEDGRGLMLLLSDGHDTRRIADPLLLDRLRRENWRVYGVSVGSVSAGRDVRLMVHNDSDVLFDGQATSIRATVLQSGYAGEQVEVRLTQDGRLVESKKTVLDAQRTTKVVFRVRPRVTAGDSSSLHAYRVEVVPLAQEQTEDNNARWTFVQVNRDRIRVGLFEAEPYWDTKFLANVLRDDVQIDVTSVHAFGEKRTVVNEDISSGDVQFEPIDPDALTQRAVNQFDVIVLGKGAERFFGGDKAKLLVDFVTRHGGSLVLARGRAFDMSKADGLAASKLLAPLEPVEWGERKFADLKVALTPSGQSSPIFDFKNLGEAGSILNRMPDMLSATQIQKEKALSVVLLNQAQKDGTPMASVAYQNTAGGGRVLAVLSDGLWRWAFLPSDESEFDSVYQLFWSRTIRWLAGDGEFLPGQSVSVRPHRMATSPGEPLAITVATRYVEGAEFKPRLRVVGPDGKVEEATLTRVTEQSSRFVATVHPQLSGVHRVELDAPGMKPEKITGRFAVYDMSMEALDTSARPETLKAICDATGGECLAMNDQEKLLDHIRNTRAAALTDRKVDYVFDHPLVFASIVLLFGLEWFFRRRWGLN